MEQEIVNAEKINSKKLFSQKDLINIIKPSFIKYRCQLNFDKYDVSFED